MWQDDLLGSRAGSRGDVIFLEGGGGLVWRREDKFSKRKEEGLTI